MSRPIQVRSGLARCAAPRAQRSGSAHHVLRAWLALVVVVFALRMPALLAPHPIDDENMYATVGVELAHGGLPYISAIERKPPLLLWTYGAVSALFGNYNWPALHVIATLWLLLSMFGLYLVARKLWDEAAGLSAALLYGLFIGWGTYKNLAWNGEMLMNLPTIFALGLTLRRDRTGIRPELLLAGALIGVAALLKQPAAIGLAALGVYVTLPAYRAAASGGWPAVAGRAGGLEQERDHRPGTERLRAAERPLRRLPLRLSLLHAVWLGLGFVLTLGAMALWLSKLGILREALYWSVLDHDVPHGPTDPVFWRRAAPATAGFAIACLPLVWGSARTVANSGRYFADRRAEYLALLCLLGVSIIGASASGRFYPHYYIQLLPALCLLCAPVGAELWHERRSESGRRPFHLAAGYLATTACVFFAIHVVTLVQSRAGGIAGDYIRTRARASDRMFVWGQAPQIYLDGRCRPASRYIATFPLTGYMFASPHNKDPNYDTTDRIVPGSWATLTRELVERPPTFIVDADGAQAVPRYPIRNYPLLRDMLANSYQRVARARDAVIYRRIDARDDRRPPAGQRH